MNGLIFCFWQFLVNCIFVFFALVFGILFQCGLLSIFLLWKPSYDDPQMFLATAFIWGCTAAVWDFAILSESLKNFFIMVFLKSVFIVSNVFFSVLKVFLIDLNEFLISLFPYVHFKYCSSFRIVFST